MENASSCLAYGEDVSARPSFAESCFHVAEIGTLYQSTLPEYREGHIATFDQVHRILEGIKLPEYGEGVNLYRNSESGIRFSDYENTEEDASAQQDEVPNVPKHRPRRNAAARRAQQLRSDARMFTRLCKGLTSIEDHRGNRLNAIGAKVLEVLRHTHGDNIDTARSQRQSRDYQRLNTCRHWLRGRCYYGSSCSFSHVNSHASDCYFNPIAQGDAEHEKRNHVHNYGHECKPNGHGEDRRDYEYGFIESHGCVDSHDGHEYGASQDHRELDGYHDRNDFQSDLPSDDISHIAEILGHLSADHATDAYDLLPCELQVEVWQHLQDRIRDTSADDGDYPRLSHYAALLRRIGARSDEATVCRPSTTPEAQNGVSRSASSLDCDATAGSSESVDTSDWRATGVDTLEVATSSLKYDGAHSLGSRFTPLTAKTYYTTDWNKLLRSLNMNRKFAAVIWDAAHFDAEVVESMLRYMYQNRNNLQTLLRDLPPECSSLEKLALRYGAKLIELPRFGASADDVVARTLKAYTVRIARVLSTSNG